MERRQFGQQGAPAEINQGNSQTLLGSTAHSLAKDTNVEMHHLLLRPSVIHLVALQSTRKVEKQSSAFLRHLRSEPKDTGCLSQRFSPGLLACLDLVCSLGCCCWLMSLLWFNQKEWMGITSPTFATGILGSS